METNRKILNIGVALIILVVILSTGLAYYLKLDNPVFLENYCEYNILMDDDNYMWDAFTIKYITNFTDKRKVVDISFEEAPNLIFYASEHGHSGYFFNMFDSNSNDSSENIYGRYIVREVYITMDMQSIDEPLEELKLSKAKVQFNNGDIMNVNLGNIILYRERNSKDCIEFTSSGSSSDGTSYIDIIVKKAITLIGVDSPLLKSKQNLFDMNVGKDNYKNVAGVKYKEEDKLTINSIFYRPKDILSQYTFYDINPKLTYKDDDGNIYTQRIYNIDYSPHRFNTKEIILYLKARGEI